MDLSSLRPISLRRLSNRSNPPYNSLTDSSFLHEDPPSFSWDLPPSASGYPTHRNAFTRLQSDTNLPSDEITSITRPSGSTKHISSQIGRGEKQRVRWHIDWRSPSLMVFFGLAGTLLAIAHHVFYNMRDGNVVNSQNEQAWSIRIGSGLAFLAQVALAAAVSKGLTQHLVSPLYGV